MGLLNANSNLIEPKENIVLRDSFKCNYFNGKITSINTSANTIILYCCEVMILKPLMVEIISN